MAGRKQNDSNQRGSRRSASTAAAAKRSASEQRGRRGWRLWLRRLILWGLALALLGLLFVGLAVAFAARSLPSFYQLQATQVGQTIVVRARDGSEIVELSHWP